MKNLNNTELLKKYIPIAEFISEIMGNNCEVVIQDVTAPNNSIIFIKNGHLTGRSVGGPLTDLVLNIIQNKTYKEKPFAANYKAVGNFKTFKSASYFIKNDNNKIIGVLCVNIDIEPYNKVKDLMDKLSFISNIDININKNEQHIKTQEQFYDNVDDLLYTMIEEAISEINILPERMSVDEKTCVVKHLYDKGAFNLKGAVVEVAKALQVSEPTIYRYLNKYK
ncbi:helix-turn-helix transcriptional regulator [Clostridium tyrobutyricum]|uniref:helix-turn-helix transcriptional regulator n=1 Tax=Clostridium tyrobutyricum TaxID=1519 RepID=UPI001F40A439|nr:PAS domain-containing protein [Clostridium tyrobutyricum]MCH4199791.1 PAS domain-containing protein [Clostridium tyrobutyricum]MCH4258582.1 PAS domain-containing protein [Clostridium tyrobutyricum]MCI1239332.1 PAS domain-containing protein [Clostridium tyrobutyricum]MCI1652803.1 PAS domain-containing protein [Clostridium tyrobutyricum]MCI1937156.1 PAS domain-containing protein [Clostridium tyrobutyricum]